MITVFSGTNRKNSRSRIVAEFICKKLGEFTKEDVRFLSMEDLPADLMHVDMYSPEGQSKALAALQDQYLIPANKFIFVLPEYNGGIPGVVKLFLDACSVRQYAESFHGGKKALLIGISAGRSGCLRGLEYMTGFLNYLKVHVYPNKLPISLIDSLITEEQLTDPSTIELLGILLEEFVEF